MACMPGERLVKALPYSELAEGTRRVGPPPSEIQRHSNGHLEEQGVLHLRRK